MKIAITDSVEIINCSKRDVLAWESEVVKLLVKLLDNLSGGCLSAGDQLKTINAKVFCISNEHRCTCLLIESF
jgi:hypothetical protein